MSKYYITNGTQYIGQSGETVDTPKLAQRFTYGSAQTYLAKHLSGEWEYRKYFISGGRYVITTSTLYVTANGNVTKDINTAKAFKSPADAVNYIKNNRKVLGNFPDPVIVNEEHEFVTKPEIKQFTPEQLATLGTVVPTPRAHIARKVKHKLAVKSGGICPICGEPMSEEEQTLDHIIPLSRGGTNDESNMRMVHERCNKFKNNLLDDEMYSMTSRIQQRRVFEHPNSDEAISLMRALLRGRINELKQEVNWENMV